jgi:hypothetical protein
MGSYHDGVTIHEVVVQYEGRLLELQAGIAQLLVPQALAAGILTIAVGLFLALSLYAIRGQVSFLWPTFCGQPCRFRPRLFPRAVFSETVRKNAGCGA